MQGGLPWGHFLRFIFRLSCHHTTKWLCNIFTWNVHNAIIFAFYRYVFWLWSQVCPCKKFKGQIFFTFGFEIRKNCYAKIHCIHSLFFTILLHFFWKVPTILTTFLLCYRRLACSKFSCTKSELLSWRDFFVSWKGEAQLKESCWPVLDCFLLGGS